MMPSEPVPPETPTATTTTATTTDPTNATTATTRHYTPLPFTTRRYFLDPKFHHLPSASDSRSRPDCVYLRQGPFGSPL
jgi:hypothetical protein